jgi:hypothetical protein
MNEMTRRRFTVLPVSNLPAPPTGLVYQVSVRTMRVSAWLRTPVTLKPAGALRHPPGAI